MIRSIPEVVLAGEPHVASMGDSAPDGGDTEIFVPVTSGGEVVAVAHYFVDTTDAREEFTEEVYGTVAMLTVP